MKKEQIIFLKSSVSDANRSIELDTLNFLKELNIDSILFEGNIFFIQSGGTEENFINIYKDFKEPYYIIATDSNNSLPAALEIESFLLSKKLRCYLFHGTPKVVRENLINKYQNNIEFNYHISLKEQLLKNTRLGVVGEPSNWLIASKVNYDEVNEKFGSEFIDISFEEFKTSIDKADIKTIGKFKNYVNDKISEKDIIIALRIYSALKSLVKKYNLDGLTVRCFDLLSSVHSTSCLALSLLNDEGIIASCEGDVPALLTMMIIYKTFKKQSFQCNPSYINVEAKYGYFAHCTLPLKMTDDFTLDTHFESGIGVGIHGIMKNTNVTIAKINSDLTKFSVFAGKIEENLYKNNLCRTQIKVIFDEPIEPILSSPCGNHLIVFYGDYSAKLISLLASKLS